MKMQHAEQRSLREVRRGMCLFGVAGAELAGRRFSVDGARVEAMAFRDLVLLVRPLRGEELHRTAEPAWLARETRMQMRLCERLSAKNALLPVKGAMPFASSVDLTALAEQAYRRWQRALARVAGKQEWLVLGYAGPHAAPGACALPLLGKALTGRRAVVPPQFFELWESATALASQARLLAPSMPRAAFAGAFLVPSERAAELRALLDRAVASAASAGITLYHAGPRAPFHFT